MTRFTPSLYRLLTATLALVTTLLFAGSARAAESITYYHWDNLGSPVATTDEQGHVKWREDYLPYGERVQHAAEATGNDRWFAGHSTDANTGLIFMGARWYDPVVGRFLSVDPVAFSDADPLTFNRYAYANDNPYRYIDPSGGSVLSVLDWCDFAKNVGGLLVQEIVYTAAVIAGDEGVQQLALEGMSNAWVDAAFSTAGLMSPVPGAGRAMKAIDRGIDAARGGARFDPSRAGHIFREAAGHANPASAGSQARFARLFEKVASNPANLRADAVQAGIITQDAAKSGVQAFTQIGKSGEQIWVTVRNGVIQNAGVNPVGALR